MALYIPHSIFHLARLLYVRPENFGPYYVLNVQCKVAFAPLCIVTNIERGVEESWHRDSET